MAMTSGWSNTIRGNAIVLVVTGVIFAVLSLAGAALYAIPVMILGAAAILVDKYLDHKSHRAHRELATQHDWTYTRRTDTFSERFVTYPFGMGRARHQTHILEGIHRDQHCVSFAHRWTDNVGSGQQQERHAFSMSILSVDADLPRIDVVSASVGTFAQTLVGGNHVSFDTGTIPESWHARAQNPDAARDVLTAPLLARWAQGADPQWSLRLDGSSLMIWHEGPHHAAVLLERLDLLIDIAAVLDLREGS